MIRSSYLKRCLALVPPLAVIAAGCHSTGQQCHREAFHSRPELIFHPSFVQLYPDEPTRPDWPLAVAYEQPSDAIAFEERIYDRGVGPSFHAQDRYWRRFESVRWGTIRR